MTTHHARAPADPHLRADPLPMALDLDAVEAARRSVDDAPRAPRDIAWRADLVQLLNDSLATEWVCVLRYRRHHFTAVGMASPKIAEEFLVHAGEEMGHADRIARRIVQLGGEPDFAPAAIGARSHAAYDASPELRAMIKADLVAERVAIECYGQLIRLVGDRDPTTRRLLEDILGDEQAHAEELSDWLDE